MLTPQLKEKIIEYLRQEITLLDLEKWMVPYESELLSDPSSADAAAISTIELCLAEWSDGLREETEIRRLLQTIIEQYEMVQLDPEAGKMFRTHLSTSQVLQEHNSIASSLLVFS